MSTCEESQDFENVIKRYKKDSLKKIAIKLNEISQCVEEGSVLSGCKPLKSITRKYEFDSTKNSNNLNFSAKKLQKISSMDDSFSSNLNR